MSTRRLLSAPVFFTMMFAMIVSALNAPATFAQAPQPNVAPALPSESGLPAESIGLGLRHITPMAKPNCGCLEYLKFRWWDGKRVSFGISDAYRMMRNVTTYNKTGDWHMAERGYRYTETPNRGSVVIMNKSARFNYWNGSKWVPTNADSVSGHAGWIKTWGNTYNGNERMFEMRHSNWAIGTSVSGGEAGCTNVRDVWVYLVGTSSFNYYR